MSCKVFYFKQTKVGDGPWEKVSGGGDKQHLVTKKPKLHLQTAEYQRRNKQREEEILEEIKTTGSASNRYYSMMIESEGLVYTINHLRTTIRRWEDVIETIQNTSKRLVKLTINEDTLETTTEVVEELTPE